MHLYLDIYFRRQKRWSTERENRALQKSVPYYVLKASDTIIYISNLLLNNLEKPTKRRQSIYVETQVIFYIYH